MYYILMDISRYLFLAYIAIFLLTSFFICLDEKNIILVNKKYFYFLQRLMIFFFHITAFIILAFNDDTLSFNFSIIPFFITSLLVIVFGNLLACFIYKKSCILLWNGIFFLLSIGIVMLYRLNQELAKKQIVWCILGLFICLLIPAILSILPRLNLFKYMYLFLGLSLLLATLLIGKEEGGAKNWISIKGFTFQPAELVKLLFIFYLASSLSEFNIKIKGLIFPSIMSIVFILCLVFQTDLGSALIFFMTFLVMVYISTSNFWFIALASFCASVGSVVAYHMFAHIKTRVTIWLNPFIDIENKGYQIAQSLFAIGTYGLMGSGLKNGMPYKIPIVEKDLIFSAICEEFGVLFAIGVILIFIMLFYRGVKISLNSQNKFLTLLSSGMTSLLCFQTFLIIGGTIKMIPLTGVTLPFISYGGSSIIITFIIIGIMQWVSIRNTKYNLDEEKVKGIEIKL